MDASGKSQSMSSGSSSVTAMSMMQIIFFTSTSTPYLSATWTPKSAGPYAGTCIFLIILAIFFRCLLAGKHFLERRWLDKELNRRYVRVRGVPTETERIDSESRGKNGTLVTVRGVEEHIRVVTNHCRPVMPWRLSVDLPRAAYVTLMAGVAYLLMLAVMTMNVGYFLSVLGGVFAGELAVGRYAVSEEH